MHRISLWPSFTLIVGLAVWLTAGDGVLLMAGLIVACTEQIMAQIKALRDEPYAQHTINNHIREVRNAKDGSVDQSERTAP